MKKLNVLISILVVLSLSLMLVSVAIAQDEQPPTDEPVTTVEEQPTDAPTEVATEEPTPEVTEEPTDVPTEEPTDVPTEEPTVAPPTEEPTVAPPTEEPTPEVTEEPTVAPPTEEPTDVVPPTEEPTAEPVPTDAAPVEEVQPPADEQPAVIEEEAVEAPEEEAVEDAEEEIIEPDAGPVDEPPEALAPASSAVSGAAATSKALSTNFTMVNLGTAAANVSLEYRLNTGALWPVGADYAGPFSLAANGGSKQLRQYFDTSMSSGKGSVVLSSDQPLGAVSQIQARNQVPSQGAYSGASGGSTQVYAPLVARQGGSASGNVNGEIVIQNTGTSSVGVAVDFYNNDNGALRYTKPSFNIPGGTSYYYDLSGETNLPTGWFGSAVVRTTTTGEVAVVANLFMGADLLQTYNGFAESQGTTSWANPSFFSRLTNGLSTVMTVQNVGASDWAASSVTATCVRTQGSGTAGFTMHNSTVVKKNAPYNFNPVTDAAIPGNWVGACTITTPGSSVLIVQMRFVGAPYPEGGAFNALALGGTAKKCSVPLIAKRLGNGFATVFTVQNLSTTSAAHVTFKYKVNAAESAVNVNVTVGPYTIPAGASLQHNQSVPGVGSGTLQHNLPDGWVGSVVVESSDQSIDCYGQLKYYANRSGDTFMAHNGFTY